MPNIAQGQVLYLSQAQTCAIYLSRDSHQTVAVFHIEEAAAVL